MTCELVKIGRKIGGGLISGLLSGIESCVWDRVIQGGACFN